MGIASSLFFSNDGEKQTLWRRVRPTDEQFEEQRARWNDLGDHLMQDLEDRSGVRVSSWLQGSYKFGTQVRPVRKGLEFDIDLGVYFRWRGEPEDGGHGAEDLRRMVQASLQAYAARTGAVIEVVEPPKARCSRVRFEGDFHIDVPVYHLKAVDDQRALALLDGGWEDSDPKAIYLWFKERFDDYTRFKVRRQVQYLKNWALRTLGDDGPSSILITTLVALEHPRLCSAESEADDEALRALAGRLADRLEQNPKVPNPVAPGEDLNRMSAAQTDTFVGKLRGLEDIGARALRAADRVEAAEIWSEAFGHFFPVSDEMIGEGAGVRASAAQVVPIRFDPDIVVEATPKGSSRSFTGRNTIGPIPKNCDIAFRVVNPIELPRGATIRWVVRNEGEEAEGLNDLGHPAGHGLVAEERSAYRGRHFMDATVWLDGRLIGRRRVPVVIQGMAMPSRAAARPAWTQLR